MRFGVQLVMAMALLYAQGCVSDEDRCDEGQVFQNGGCTPVGSDATSRDQSMADTFDLDEVDGGALPSGMNDPCNTPADCGGKDASYCLIQPGQADGVCTVEDCNATNNDCPGGFTCCDMPVEGIPNYCAADEDYTTMKAMNLCS